MGRDYGGQGPLISAEKPSALTARPVLIAAPMESPSLNY